MTRRDRIRRTTSLCQHFARNLAYYRVGWESGELARSRSQFWRTVNGNCIDICILEWCKLFGDSKDEHGWRKMMKDSPSFERDLLVRLHVSEQEFAGVVEKMRKYRDRFVAHLDSDCEFTIPQMDIPKTSVWFYHSRLSSKEPEAAELRGFWDLDNYYSVCESEARGIYSSR